MPVEFDPYRELLGIVTTNRPPDHYTLLGLELFESDRQKIDDAATERMGQLQDMANSDLVDHSQRLLNELSAARRCLLNAVQKVAYDETIRAKVQRAKRSGKSVSGTTLSPSKKQTLIISTIIGGVVLILLIVTLLLYRSNRGGNLIVEWPLSEREDGLMYVDAQLRELPATDPVRIFVPEGRHIVEFHRNGFRRIEQRVQINKAPVRLKLRWIAEKK